MAKKHDAFYFENFITCTDYACQAANLLVQSFREFDPSRTMDMLKRMREVEHAADEQKHELLHVLGKAFITPIEREDIILLSQNIDDMTDKIEDVLLRVSCNNIQSIRPDAITLSELVVRCCEEVKRMVAEFADFRHSKNLHDYIVHINSMEEESDQLFISSMHTLHTTSQDPIEIIVWREVYIYLEKAADACEHVADTIESIVTKNS